MWIGRIDTASPRGVVRKELTDAGFRVPDVLTFTETLRAVVEGTRSLARFGDGERTLMLDGQDIPFQKWSPEIADELKRVAANAYGRPCDIGVNRAYLYRTGAEQEQVERFYAEYELPMMLADRYPDYLTMVGRAYLDASFTIPYHHYRTDAFPERFFAKYFASFAEAFNRRDVILAAGNGVLEERHGYAANLLAMTHTVEEFVLPDRDAYAEIDSIESALAGMNKDGKRTVLLSCGPTATVLAYRLSDRMRAIDIGHAMRECDRVVRGVPPDDHGEFFAS
jgi:hypothetical protein